MTVKEYRICVSETPEGLACQVNELLSSGWSLHGHPFSEAQTFCQAMVKGTVAQVIARPARPPVRASFRNVAVWLALLAGCYLLAESLIFRSGLYARYLDPDGATGSFERALWFESHRPSSGKKDILVIGNSRIAEGFSARLANQSVAGEGYWFLNGGVSGTGDRSWYYLVRDIDPDRNRYKAILIPIDDYDDPDDFEDVADRAGEMRPVINRIRLTDIVPFTLSFNTWRSRLEVLRGLLFEGIVYQGDLQNFAEHPSERLERLRTFDKDGASWAYAYNGIDHTMAGMSVDWVNRRITFNPPVTEDQQHTAEAIFLHNPPQDGKVRAYETRWLGPLVDLYRGSKTRIIVFQVPRSPAPPPVPLAHLPWTIANELAKRPWVTVVDRHRFEPLEKPELFADHVHLNSSGRKIFSPMLADLTKEILN